MSIGSSSLWAKYLAVVGRFVFASSPMSRWSNWLNLDTELLRPLWMQNPIQFNHDVGEHGIHGFDRPSEENSANRLSVEILTSARDRDDRASSDFFLDDYFPDLIVRDEFLESSVIEEDIADSRKRAGQLRI